MFEIIRYTPDKADEWNQFVATSKNGTFLFDRRYMDYHSDRFEDYSLIISNKGKLFALLPANKDGDTLHTHQGLTYGGLVTDSKATADAMLTLMQELNAYLRDEVFHHVRYKAVPWHYHLQPAEEDLYAIFRVCDARFYSREVSSVIPLSSPLKWTTLRQRCLKKALAQHVEVRESNDLATFWTILSENLWEKFKSHPVHTLDEITLLQQRFPDNIRLFAAFQGTTMIGGMLFYISQQVVHTQYISANEEGLRLGAIDAIMATVLPHFSDYRYFDLGRSTTEHGQGLNSGLIFQKEGFGARTICYDTYEWDIKS